MGLLLVDLSDARVRDAVEEQSSPRSPYGVFFWLLIRSVFGSALPHSDVK